MIFPIVSYERDTSLHSRTNTHILTQCAHHAPILAVSAILALADVVGCEVAARVRGGVVHADLVGRDLKETPERDTRRQCARIVPACVCGWAGGWVGVGGWMGVHVCVCE